MTMNTFAPVASASDLPNPETARRRTRGLAACFAMVQIM